MKTFAALILGTVLLAAGSPLAAKDFTVAFKQYKLKNGLTAILSEDHAAPTLGLVVCYDVGSRDEQPGRTGVAHFFEHMMFQGSANWVFEEMQTVPQPLNVNGNTTVDRTCYTNTLPANQLDLGLFFEADRMHLLALPPDRVEIQRGVVKEERRISTDNQPYGKTNELLYDTAYDAFPYKHPVVGSMADLDAATMEEFRAFYKRYYAPNNATLVIVGDFKSDIALAKVKQYFEEIPRQPAPPRPDLAEPPQSAERRRTVQSELAQTPRIDIAYKIPPGNSPDWYAIAVLSQILGGGGSSRLRQQLVQDKGMASSVSAWAEERRGPGLARVSIGSPGPQTDLAALEKEVYDEIARLKTEPVANWEMEKVRISSRRWRVSDNESFLGRAAGLAEAAVVFGDANRVNIEPQKLAKVSKEDIMRVARTYFTESNRTVVVTLPKGK